jgi:hypothetical protein
VHTLWGAARADLLDDRVGDAVVRALAAGFARGFALTALLVACAWAWRGDYSHASFDATLTLLFVYFADKLAAGD